MLRRYALPFRLCVMLSLLASLTTLTGLTSTLAATEAVKVVASGLDNPRGLAFSPEGALYVAEAGRGGDRCISPDPAAPDVQLCYGSSGAITRVEHGVQEEVATNLPSFAEPGGNFAAGPHDVSLLAHGQAAVVVGLGLPPAERALFGNFGANFGQLVRVEPDGERHNIADLAAYEEAHDPDNMNPDSNPYAVLALSGRRIVVDAGGNTMLHVDPDGTIWLLAVFPTRVVPTPPDMPDLPPEISMHSVPTSVVVGPDGAYYVGELTGFPFPVGGAQVYRVVPGHAPKVYAEGFTNIIDLAFDADGNLYVLEIAAKGLLQAEGPDGDFTGALIRVTPDGTRTELAAGQLTAPTGLAIGADGALYVSTFGVFAGQGQVVRISGCQEDEPGCLPPTPLPTPLVATLIGKTEVDKRGQPGQGDPDGSALATLTLDTNTRKVCAQIFVADSAQSTQAHIHQGKAGTNGPIVVDFTPFISSNIISGCVEEVAPAVLDAMQAKPSNYYVNVHTAEYPAGAMRGQLVPGDADDQGNH
jgi:sugar lactone lactonase YvrE